MSRFLDKTGQRYGRLRVICQSGWYEYGHGRKAGRKPVWLCECDCGNEVEVQGGNLATGNTTSCGCFHSEITRELIEENRDIAKSTHSQFHKHPHQNFKCPLCNPGADVDLFPVASQEPTAQ
jgi:hypothetical protein